METGNPDQQPVSAQPSSAADPAEAARVEPIHLPRSGARGWMMRGLFEAGPILLGLLGAFALNQWQNARIRADRADAMLGAIRAELEANLALQQKAAEYNTLLVDELKKLRESGQSFVPAEVYRGGLLRRPHLTAAAWISPRGVA